MGSGSESHLPLCAELGRWLAGRQVHLLTGGGAGVMAAVSRAFRLVPERKGLVLGILPCGDVEAGRPPAGYPNASVEIAIATHLPHSGAAGIDPLSRNHINVLTSDVIVALPGGAGTASEVALAVRYGRPIIVYLECDEGMAEISDDVPSTTSLAELKRFVDAELRRLRGLVRRSE